VKNYGFWGALLGQNSNNIIMGISIMDYECFSTFFGDLNVPAKREVLGSNTLRASSKIISGAVMA
jgi:hypothetical protein